MSDTVKTAITWLETRRYRAGVDIPADVYDGYDDDDALADWLRMALQDGAVTGQDIGWEGEDVQVEVEDVGPDL